MISAAASRGEAEPVDLEFGWSRDLADRKRDLRIHVQSTRKGGVWIIIDRNPTASASAA
jgi:hypothetical protein